MTDIERQLTDMTVKLEQGEVVTVKEVYDLVLFALVSIKTLQNELHIKRGIDTTI